MKTGIFPLNPHAIDHSRVLKGNSSNARSSSTTHRTSGGLNDHLEHSSSIEILPSTTSTDLSFSTSIEAIAVLDKIIEETSNNDMDASNIDNDGNITDGSDFNATNQDIQQNDKRSTADGSSLKSRISKRRRSTSFSHDQSKTSNEKSKRKRSSKKIIGFDMSTDDEEDGMIISENIVDNSDLFSFEFKRMMFRTNPSIIDHERSKQLPTASSLYSEKFRLMKDEVHTEVS